MNKILENIINKVTDNKYHPYTYRFDLTAKTNYPSYCGQFKLGG